MFLLEDLGGVAVELEHAGVERQHVLGRGLAGAGRREARDRLHERGHLPAGSAEDVPENAIEANITKAKCFGNELLRMRFLRKKPCKSVFPSRLRNSTAGRRTRRARHTWLPAALRRELTLMSAIAYRDHR